MSDLKDRLIRLGSQNPDLRKHLKPILDKVAGPQEEVFDLAMEGNMRDLQRKINQFSDEVENSKRDFNSYRDDQYRAKSKSAKLFDRLSDLSKDISEEGERLLQLLDERGL
jgi:chromosome segregation ATPase